MTYGNDIGLSNIRVPNENSTLLYKYTNYNTFPEEVYVHEFLHGLERIEKEYGNEVIELHSYAEHGYQDDEIEGLKKWYKDYMQGRVQNSKLGLSKEVFSRKPVHSSNFTNSIDFSNEIFSEPQNLLEDIQKQFIKTKKYIYEELINANI